MKLSSILGVFIVFVFAACSVRNDVYEKLASFPRHEWPGNEKKTFTFEIKDSSAQYRLYFVFRHFEAYRYKNIWLNIQLKAPDTMFSVRREFILTDNEQWHGNTIDDIVEQRIVFDAEPALLKPGAYTITLQQIMREDPLQGVLNAGVRIEKVNP